MSANVGTVSLEVKVSDKGAVVLRHIGQEGDKAGNKGKKSFMGFGRTLGDTERKAESLTGSLLKVGGAVVGIMGVKAAITKLKGETFLAIGASSDLQEISSKFSVVFTGQEERAEAWTKVLVDGYAMSNREAKQYLSSVQDLLVPMGMQAAAAGDMSNEVVKLSADLGSFNNLPTARVMDDIQSALVGNYETMKKYGVVLSATVVEEKALAMGLVASKEELTAAEKAQAAYQLMVEGSSAAVGDMGRTQDGYANQLKESTARIEDIRAALGDGLLPISTMVVSEFNKWTGGLLDNRQALVDLTKDGVLWLADGFVKMLDVVRVGYNVWAGFRQIVNDAIVGILKGIDWLLDKVGAAYEFFGMENPFASFQAGIVQFQASSAEVAKQTLKDWAAVDEKYGVVRLGIVAMRDKIAAIPAVAQATDEVVIKGQGDIQKAYEVTGKKATAARKAAEKAAKEQQKITKQLYDRLKWETSDYYSYKSEAYLRDYNEAVDAGVDIELAMQDLNSRLMALDVEEYEHKRGSLQAHLQELRDAGTVRGSDYLSALDALRELDKTYGADVIKAAKDTATQAAGPMVAVFEDAASSIHGAFVDMFEDIFDGGIRSFEDLGDSLLSIFKNILAQMAAMAIANPIIVPMIRDVGSMMGLDAQTIAGVAGQFGIGTAGTAGAGSYSSSIAGIQSMVANGFAMLGQQAFDIGLTGISNGLIGAADVISNLGSAAFAGWSAGIGTFVVDLMSGADFEDAVAHGLGAGGGAYLGAQLGTAILPGLGTLLGAIGGGFLGALGVDKLLGLGDNPERFGVYNVPKNTDTTFDVSSGFDPILGGFSANHQPSYQASTALQEGIATIQASFSDMVMQFTDTLPTELADDIKTRLSEVDYSTMFSNWVTADLVEVQHMQRMLENELKNYAEGLEQALSDAYASALSDFISTQGAAGLLGDVTAWNYLTDSAQDAIEAAFQQAADMISGAIEGGIEGGIELMNGITDQVAQISQALEPINAIIATADLTDYERQLYDINAQFDVYAAQLAAAGIDLEKYTDLEKARAIALQEVYDAVAETTAAEQKAITDQLDYSVAVYGMSDLDVAVFDITNKFSVLRDELVALGVDLDLTNVSIAEQIELESAHYAAELKAAQAAQEATQTAFDAADTALGSAFQAEQDAIQAASDAVVGQLNEQVAAAQESASILGSVSGQLQSALGQMFADAGPTEGLIADAQGQLAAALTAARGGDFTAATNLDSALQVLTSMDSGSFSSAFEAKKAAVTAYLNIEELGKLTDDQLSVEEQLLASLEEQILAEQESADAQIAALDEQLDAIRGVENAVLSVEDAITAFTESQTALTTAEDTVQQLTDNPTQLDFPSMEELADQYAQIEAQAVAQALIDALPSWFVDATWESEIAYVQSYLAGLAATQEALDYVNEYLAEQNPTSFSVPAFAAGGDHAGGWAIFGEEGPELANTGPARVYSNKDSLFDISPLVAEVRALRKQLSHELYQNTVHAQKTAKLLKKFDTVGLGVTSKKTLTVEVAA